MDKSWMKFMANLFILLFLLLSKNYVAASVVRLQIVNKWFYDDLPIIDNRCR